jgi:hypothetical protein
MADDNKTVEAPLPELDERAIGKKYGIRELVYPDSEQVKALSAFLELAVETGRCGPLPKTAVVVLHDFLQATVNRQHITKGPRMSQDEFDLLQVPYYAAARIIARIQRRRHDNSKDKLYQTTYLSLNHFIELLSNLLDPGCYWIRVKMVPDGVREGMADLLEFLILFSDQRRKDRGL